MPYIGNSTYVPSRPLRSPHVQAVLSNNLRRLGTVHYTRERISTPDHDFLDLDWAELASETLVIISHGMVGNTSQSYVKGMVKACQRRNFSALAWNSRGCSEEINRLPKFYHGGDTSDLRVVLHHVIATRHYKKIALIGFSMGGNIILKYLAEESGVVDAKIYAAAVFSVPCDIQASALKFAEHKNRFYLRVMMNTVKKMMAAKNIIMPGSFPPSLVARINNFTDIIELHTVPAFGYESPEHYWREASSLHKLSNIAVPTLLINAKDDLFLPDSCYPVETAQESEYLFLETPQYGGHVGFATLGGDGEYWSEHRAMQFLREIAR